jgi:linoleoyl-CoA desaturase
MKLVIHKKIYDLIDFNHPGGLEILELCKNEPDCTALFESYHAFCDMDKIKNTMKKYEVDESKDKSLFSIKQEGFYNTCKNRVNELFSNRRDSKYNSSWLKYVGLSSFTFIISQLNMIYGNEPTGILNIGFALLSGISLTSIGYNVLHDGSHYSISKYPIINNTASKLIQSLLLQNHTMWTYHHCIRHHQYTGLIKYDPDLHNASPFLRKSSKFEPRFFEFSKSFIGLKLLLFNIIFPGTLFGQSMSYHFIWRRKTQIWKLNLPESFGGYSDKIQDSLSICFILFELYYIGIVYFYLHIVGCNIAYYFGSAPDHDMYVTHLEIEKNEFNNNNNNNNKNNNNLSVEIMDWGEMQVRHSGNFCNSYTALSNLFGGINYQIEHHLFPTLNSHKLKEIAPIVKKCCKDFNIPYNHIDNPLEVWSQICKVYTNIHS